MKLIDWPKYSWCFPKESSVLSKRIDDAKRKQSIYSQKSIIPNRSLEKNLSFSTERFGLKDQLIHRWHKIKECIRIVFYEPSNKWYRNVYVWICIILTLLFTIYEVVNVNRLKAYNEDLQTIAARHQMTREIKILFCDRQLCREQMVT